jgi:hypothetical protein
MATTGVTGAAKVGGSAPLPTAVDSTVKGTPSEGDASGEVNPFAADDVPPEGLVTGTPWGEEGSALIRVLVYHTRHRMRCVFEKR